MAYGGVSGVRLYDKILHFFDNGEEVNLNMSKKTAVP